MDENIGRKFHWTHAGLRTASFQFEYVLQQSQMLVWSGCMHPLYADF